MVPLTANSFACAVIFAWAIWCVLSHRVNDGIIGKACYASVAIAALAALVGSRDAHPETVLHIAFALLGIRHFFIKVVLPWVFNKVTIL